METSREPSAISNPQSPANPEVFAPPEITDLASLTDGRRIGEYCSAYPVSAWVQISMELFYLVFVLLSSFTGLIFLATFVSLKREHGLIHDWFGPLPNSLHLVAWAGCTLAGAIGGCTSSLKWLYHAIAKKRWHRDRIIWRLVVPLLSAMLAVFSGLMIVSGLVPFLARAPLTVPATATGYGFFVGLFSDNVLAALQKLAFHIFGTVDKH